MRSFAFKAGLNGREWFLTHVVRKPSSDRKAVAIAKKTAAFRDQYLAEIANAKKGESKG